MSLETGVHLSSRFIWVDLSFLLLRFAFFGVLGLILVHPFFVYRTKQKYTVPRIVHSILRLQCFWVFQSRVSEWVTLDMWPLEPEAREPCFDYDVV